jgi:hypothetical protein
MGLPRITIPRNEGVTMEKMIEEAVIVKLRQLPIGQQQEVLNFVEILENKASKKASAVFSLKEAAYAALAEYENDPELTAFTALDGEDFHV